MFNNWSTDDLRAAAESVKRANRGDLPMMSRLMTELRAEVIRRDEEALQEPQTGSLTDGYYERHADEDPRNW